VEIPTGFVRAEANGFQIVTRPVYYKLALSIAERDPERLLATGQAPGEPMRGRGARLELPGEGGETLILKKNRRGGLYGRLFGDIHRTDYRAIGEIILGESAWKKGVPVALMAFAMSAPAGEGRLAKYRRGYSASIKVPGARNLMEWLSGDGDETERRAVIAATGYAINRAHNRGLKHGDLNLGNILVVRSEQGEYGAWLIDLSHSTLGGALSFKPRVENLVRLYRSLEKWLPVTGETGARRRFREIVYFLRAYTDREPGGVRKYLAEAARHRASLAMHRLSWKARPQTRRARQARPRAAADR